MPLSTVMTYAAVVFATYINPQGYPREERMLANYRTQEACLAGIAAFERRVQALGQVKEVIKSKNCKEAPRNHGFNLWQEDKDAAAAAAEAAASKASQ